MNGCIRPLPAIGRRSRRPAALFRGVCALALSAAIPPVTQAHAAGKEHRFLTRADLISEYTDNLFHYSKRRLDEFDAEDADGERFHGLDGSSDVVTRLRLRPEYRWRPRKERELRVSLGVAYYQHARNTIADYLEISTGLEADVTKRDRLVFDVSQTIDRFGKNFKDTAADLFDAAFYDETDVRIGYTRRFGKRWDGGADYEMRRRRYNEKFSSRDSDGDYLNLRSSYSLGNRIDAETSFSYGVIESETGIDDGIPIDRSYDERRLAQSFKLGLSYGMHLGVDGVLRSRDYTTDVQEDEGRYKRKDDYSMLRLEIGKEWKNGLSAALRGALIDSDSDRIDPTVETDETGYEESTLSVEIAYRF